MAILIKKETDGEVDLLSLEYECQFRLISGTAHAYYHGLDLHRDDVLGPVAWSTMQVGRLCVALSASNPEQHAHTTEMFRDSKDRIVKLAESARASAMLGNSRNTETL